MHPIENEQNNEAKLMTTAEFDIGMNNSDELIAKAVVGSLVNGVALGLLLSYVGQVYFSETGFFIGSVVGFLLSMGSYLIFSTLSSEHKLQSK